jgi:hypothetical protein
MIVDYSGGYNVLKGKAKSFIFSIYSDDSTAYNPNFATYVLEKSGVEVDSGNCSIDGNEVTAAISSTVLADYATGMWLKITFGRAYPYPDEEYSHGIIFHVVKNAINNPVTAAALCIEWPKLLNNAETAADWQPQINLAYQDTLSDLAKKTGYIGGVASTGDLGKLFRLNAAYYCFRNFSGEELMGLAEKLKADYNRELATVQFYADLANNGTNDRRQATIRCVR